MVTVYYRDPHVQVTSDAVRVDGVSYPVTALELVWHHRGSGTTRTRSRRLGRGVLILIISILPLAAIVCAISLVYSASDRAAWGLAAGVLAVGVIGALALAPLAEVPLGWLDRSYDRGNAVNELWVRYAGEDRLLLRTSDALRFGQIYRAVQRAVEQHG
ncbi:hypothetical protein Ais01nite_53130 [Asanoa ishikariensis]|uniref:Uncharacterized protein n=1 Tax=Asanoa ishikariensis TaxID=137265 RepID=A0A1H3REU2_9ACTN|nr:hypothetical protein Ais01nite_53130 [Asanoa ishikariensis]SDZ24140.1 hypothetical protein SAMN05421684_3764 [Asanoa ishikariensis]